MAGYLRVLSPGAEERRFELETDVVGIGRSAENALSITDLSLSREHARIRRGPAGWTISDRGSRNGTWLNDRPVVGELPLRDGDVVRLGETMLVFRDEESSGVRLGGVAAELVEGSVAIPADKLLSSTFRSSGSREARLLDVFARTSRMLIGNVQVQEVYAQALDAAIGAVHAERGALMLLEGDPPALAARAMRSRPGDPDLVVSRSIARLALEEQTSVLTTDAQADPRFDASHSVSMQGIRAAMCAPLWNDGRVIGLMYLDRRFSARQFSESDLTLLTVLGNLTAAKLENLKLLEEAQQKRKLEEELRLAAGIQRNLLPAADPELAGWDVAGVSLPSRSVGGDLFDYIPLAGGRIALVVADVSGKGVSAALLMASLQANLRAFAETASGPGDILHHVNRAVCKARLRSRFATVFYVDLDPLAGVARYVSAGHNPGLLIRAGRVELLAERGLIIGAFESVPPYREGTFRMETGDMLVLYSDGVTEAARDDEEMFGEERLVELAGQLGKLGAAAARDAVLEAVHGFTGGRPPGDDTTILIARRL